MNIYLEKIFVSNKKYLLPRYCIHRSGTYNIHVEYCTCRKKDGCNGAGETRLSWGLALVVTLAAVTRARTLS